MERNMDRKSSIETEPRALSIQQLQFAREAALYVINTRTAEEALEIFTQGLKPVVNLGRQDDIGMLDSDNNQLDCSSHLPRLREILSAPF